MKLPWTRVGEALPLALALQGGGAHGAFTWGVLDRLLDEPHFVPGAVSGTSAGALNAVALAHGWAEGGREGARAALERLWHAVGSQVPFELFTTGPSDNPALNAGTKVMMQWLKLFSPAQLNPTGTHPLREIVEQQIDFERLRRADAPRVFVAATHANSGRLRLFGNAELCADAVLASACLPQLQAAVEIDGEPYWDGGYCANPALFPLARSGIADLLIVALAPLDYAQTPVQPAQINERALEFAFQTAFLCELRLIAESSAEARRGWWPGGSLERRLRRLRLHLLDAQDDLSGFAAETRLIAHLPFLEKLRELGHARAEQWLGAHGDSLGRESSLDPAQIYGRPAP